MAERKSSRSKSTETETGSAVPETFASAMLDMQKAGMGPAFWLGTAWLEKLGEVGSELTDFVAERIREDVRTQHEILHCKDPEELQDIQARFISRAVEMYSAETGRLVEMSQEFVDRLRTGGKD